MPAVADPRAVWTIDCGMKRGCFYFVCRRCDAVRKCGDRSYRMMVPMNGSSKPLLLGKFFLRHRTSDCRGVHSALVYF
eukprot:scaffold30384_cov53-Attheya_sp.AAC.12